MGKCDTMIRNESAMGSLGEILIFVTCDFVSVDRHTHTHAHTKSGIHTTNTPESPRLEQSRFL